MILFLKVNIVLIGNNSNPSLSRKRRVSVAFSFFIFVLIVIGYTTNAVSFVYCVTSNKFVAILSSMLCNRGFKISSLWNSFVYLVILLLSKVGICTVLSPKIKFSICTVLSYIYL